MPESEGPFGEPESRRLTPSIGLTSDSDAPTDSSNEDFLFHLYRGSELLQDNRVHEAKEELERALHLQPRDSKGQDLLAVVYFRLGLYPRAIQIYEELRRKNTDDTALLLNLALCYLKTGQPQLARRDLQHLLALNPTHSRAWGYLGLACERLGDLVQAERAFAQGGHRQMAKRLSGRRDPGAGPASGGMPSQEVRDAAGAAYQELDAGELSFTLAEPTSDRNVADRAGQSSWSAHELGQVRANERPEKAAPAAQAKPETRKPDTRDGPPPAAPPPQALGQSQAFNRRPTLIAPVGAPPAHEIATEFATVERIPSQNSPSFTVDDAASLPPSVRHPVVAVPSPFGPAKSHDVLPNVPARRTLPPPVVKRASTPPPPPPAPTPEPTVGVRPPIEETPQPHVGTTTATLAAARPPSVRAPRPSEPRAHEAVRFPSSGVVLHPSGVALVRSTSEIGFAARLESIRAQQSHLKMQLLERRTKGKSTGESFGGVTSPMVLASGEGQLVLAPRPGRHLTALPVGGEMCFVREDVLLGFGGGLSFENGRLTTGEGETIAVVQLRGDGAVLLEAMGETLTLDVRPDRSLNVRREAILGWFGRLVPRALSPNEAPCGQRGLVGFSGEGHVILASV